MNLALIVVNIEYEFSYNLINGAREYCQEHGHNLFVFPVKAPNWQMMDFGYHEWCITKFINSNNIDGLIIPSASQVRFITMQEYYRIVENFKKEVPVVSVITAIPGLPSVVVETKEAFEYLVRHTIREHGRRKLAFLNASGDNEDIKMRYDVFRNVLREEGIEFDEKLNFCGDFSYSSSEAIIRKFKRKEDVPFDALICVTDEMALGALSSLQNLGVRVPEDVIVTGFDDIQRVTFTKPSLSTVNQKIFLQAYKSCEVLEKSCKGIPVDNITRIKASYRLRQSCGCIPKNEVSFKTISEEGSIYESDVSEILGLDFLNSHDHIIHLLEFIEGFRSGMSLKKLSDVMESYFERFEIDNVAVCLFEKPIYSTRENKRVIPDKARLYFVKSNSSGIHIKDDQQFFDCSRDILPKYIKKSFSGACTCQIIYHSEQVFGYLMMKLDKHGYHLYRLILSMLSKFIVTAYEVTVQKMATYELTRKNNSLAILSKTDEMTGILNRRGFLTSAQQVINLSVDIGKTGLVIYGDMDGLKKINDTYGHDAGDRAIIAEVDLLKKTFRSADTFGRLGGDEFAILSISLSFEMFERLKKRLDNLCDEWNRHTKEPFKISISLGAVQFSVQNYDLVELLKEADERQYIEKRRKKIEAGIISV